MRDPANDAAALRVLRSRALAGGAEPMDVVMYVMNDVRHDSRVLREAGTLAAAGHRVTIVGSSAPADLSAREEVGGVTIIRVPEPAKTPLYVTWADRPWRLHTRLIRALKAPIVQGPSGVVTLSKTLLAAVVSLPWVGIRAAWIGVRRLIGRTTGRPEWVAYLGLWRGRRLVWARNAAAAAPPAQVHHAHDLEALPAALAAGHRDGAFTVYDSHEIFTAWGALLRQPFWLRAAFARWERRLARQTTALVTINDELAGELDRALHPRRVVVVYNCPPRWQPPPLDPGHLRRAAGIPENATIVLCHGNLQANRGLEATAEAMTRPGLERAHLVFLGYGRRVVEPILIDPRLAGRVHVLDPVAPDDLLGWIAGADVDVMAIPDVDLNSRLSSPNKLFESLAAGVPVVTSDLPVRRRIVLEDPTGPLGSACDPDDPDSIAAAIRSILDLDPARRAELRARCLAAAHGRWNWETESRKLIELYEELATRVEAPEHATTQPAVPA